MARQHALEGGVQDAGGWSTSSLLGFNRPPWMLTCRVSCLPGLVMIPGSSACGAPEGAARAAAGLVLSWPGAKANVRLGRGLGAPFLLTL